jgi:hypothetical protein
MARIKLTGKYAVGQYEYALVDDDIVEELSRWRWKAKPNGSGSGVYAVRNTMRDGKYVTLRMHRVVLGMDHTNPLDVDHDNHNTIDNRRVNLKPATRSQNMLNAQYIERTVKCNNCESIFTRTVVIAHSQTTLVCDLCLTRSKQRAPQSTVHFQNCVECQKMFTARRTGALFCTEACRCRARYKRGGSHRPTSKHGACARVIFP